MFGLIGAMFDLKVQKIARWNERAGAMTNEQITAPSRKSYGEKHYKADLTDHEVELVRQLHEEGWGYRRLAKKFEIHRATIQKICTFRSRRK